MPISEKIRNSISLLSGLVYEDTASGGGEIAKGSNGRVHVLPAAETAGVLVSSEASNPSTTQGTLTFAGGLLSVEISLLNLSSSNINYAYITFDALDSSDGATRLASVGTRELIKMGEVREFQFSPETPVYRIDYISDIASGAITGTGVLRFTAKGVA